MKVLIIEDEIIARDNLAKAIRYNFPDMEIVGMTSSIKESVEWLGKNSVDVIFMDIELSDGIAFEIFNKVRIKASVIMTTAFSTYAVKAFEVGSLDYLMKPISHAALERAVSRIRNSSGKVEERFIVKMNGKIIPVKVSDIAYFYSENKNNFLMMFNGLSYVVDRSLNEIMDRLNPDMFYQVGRGCIVSANAIKHISRSGERNALEVEPEAPFELSISRGRMEGFMKWLESRK